jgi:hypothetical protein
MDCVLARVCRTGLMRLRTESLTRAIEEPRTTGLFTHTHTLRWNAAPPGLLRRWQSGTGGTGIVRMSRLVAPGRSPYFSLGTEA